MLRPSRCIPRTRCAIVHPSADAGQLPLRSNSPRIALRSSGTVVCFWCQQRLLVECPLLAHQSPSCLVSCNQRRACADGARSPKYRAIICVLCGDPSLVRATNIPHPSFPLAALPHPPIVSAAPSLLRLRFYRGASGRKYGPPLTGLSSAWEGGSAPPPRRVGTPCRGARLREPEAAQPCGPGGQFPSLGNMDFPRLDFEQPRRRATRLVCTRIRLRRHLA